MAETIIKSSFAGGELTSALDARVDLTKYQVGAHVMRNFIVDYRGGASTRPGTQFVDTTRVTQNPPRAIPFVFNTDQSYVLLLCGNRMRVYIDGAPLVEGAINIVSVGRGTSTVLT